MCIRDRAYSLSDDGLAVNLYGSNTLRTQLLDGSEIHLEQSSQYPWHGDVTITLQKCKDTPFEVRLRIPEWADRTAVKLNGKNAGIAVEPGTYATIKRRWRAGDVIQLEMPMDIRLIEGDPRIEEVRNQVTIKRGPVVYCVESPDLPENTDILSVYLPQRPEFVAQYRPEFLGGMTTISGNTLLRSDTHQGTYRTLTKPVWESQRTTFVPYYAWCNRGQGEMTVWMPIVWD